MTAAATATAASAGAAPATAMDHQPPSAAWAVVRPFALGGLAGCGATAVVHPADTLKVRAQVAGEGAAGRNVSPAALASRMVRAEGVGALYAGLSAGLLRQCTYTTARMGVFRSLSDWRQEANGGGPLPAHEKALCGLGAGFVGAYIGCPADVALVRMQSDAALPPAQRRGYKHAFDALAQMARREGIGSFWVGSTPTVVRGMVVNMAHLATYDEAKQQIAAAFGVGERDAATQLAASAASGLAISVASLPVDFVKTRMMKQVPNPDGTMPYAGPLDCVAKVLRREGPLRFYAGFGSYFARCAPHAMLTLLFAEALSDAARAAGA